MAMDRIDLIDSHVHLWPASAANPEGHRWMKEGELLTKQHILDDYYQAIHKNNGDESTPFVRGIIYIETDRRLLSPNGGALSVWAHQAVEEIKFLRQIVEGQGTAERTYTAGDAEKLVGIVLWAPVNMGPAVFEEWLKLAKDTAGETTWDVVKGFRFLLQGITDQLEFEKLVLSDDFIATMRLFRAKGRNFSFDVGVDQHSGGVWQLEAMVKVIERVHEGVPEDEKVTFILSALSSF